MQSITRRILLLVVASLLPLILGFSIIFWASIRQAIEGTEEIARVKARITGESLGLYLEKNLIWLSDIALNLSFEEPSKEVLQLQNPYGLLHHGLMAVDTQGNVRASWPETTIGKFNLGALWGQNGGFAPNTAFVSSIVTEKDSGRLAGFLFAPIRGPSGKVSGWVGGEIDLKDPIFSRLVEAARGPSDLYFGIVDSSGQALAFSGDHEVFPSSSHNFLIARDSRNGGLGSFQCRSCHSKKYSEKTMAISDVPSAPWSIVVVTKTKDSTGYAFGLWGMFGLLGFGLMAYGLILGVGMSRSILGPIRQLIEAAERMKAGDLSTPIPIQGNDEISRLAQSFEQSRLQLLDSFRMLKEAKESLEVTVEERTRQVKSLLGKVITSQEEERKRVARELHDVILQDITAFLMKLDAFALISGKDQARIEKMKGFLVKAMEDIRAVIQDLRPSILDDLGLGAALRWLVDLRFKGQGCQVSVEVKECHKGKLDPLVETTTFRIAQEALTNILKHAKASRVSLKLTCSQRKLKLFIHDNGVGFAVGKLQDRASTESGLGIGLQGMAERALLIGGKLKIRSSQGRGTHVGLFITLEQGEML